MKKEPTERQKRIKVLREKYRKNILPFTNERVFTAEDEENARRWQEEQYARYNVEFFYKTPQIQWVYEHFPYSSDYSYIDWSKVPGCRRWYPSDDYEERVVSLEEIACELQLKNSMVYTNIHYEENRIMKCELTYLFDYYHGEFIHPRKYIWNEEEGWAIEATFSDPKIKYSVSFGYGDVVWKQVNKEIVEHLITTSQEPFPDFINRLDGDYES